MWKKEEYAAQGYLPGFQYLFYSESREDLAITRYMHISVDINKKFRVFKLLYATHP